MEKEGKGDTARREKKVSKRSRQQSLKRSAKIFSGGGGREITKGGSGDFYSFGERQESIRWGIGRRGGGPTCC